MTIKEFSNEFDTQVAAYLQGRAFGQAYSNLEFDEYEKSVFLTKGQEAYVIGLYNGNNPAGLSFEKTEEARRYLADLVKTDIITDINTYPLGVSSDSYIVTLPPELWFITYEAVNFVSDAMSCSSMLNDVTVTPVTQDEYHRIKKNPFRGANDRRVLRLDIGLDENGNKTMELVSKYGISAYKVRYLSQPEPIILVDLNGTNLSINNKKDITECSLHPALHRSILDNAIILAISSRAQSAPKEQQ